jgi:phytoene/squalene synthetase
MNTLEDLYYGNLFPQEKCARLDDDVKELLKLLNRNEEKLISTLSDEQKETFEKYKDCNREISEICEREIFLNGFRLGARIIIDIVNN